MHRCTVSLIGLVLIVGACSDGEPSAGTSAETTTAVVITHPPPGSPGGGLRITNPCDEAVVVEVRLAAVGEEATTPKVIKTVQAGRTASMGGYGFAEETGPRELLIAAPELGWTAREPAREDGSAARVSIDPESCPGAE
jgi:hypothetical protein